MAVAISRFISTIDCLSGGFVEDDTLLSIMERDLRDGQHRNPSGEFDYFTTAYFHKPVELEAEVRDAGFADVTVYGLEGPAWLFPDIDERWADEARRERMMAILRRLETEPELLGASGHLLAVGRVD